MDFQSDIKWIQSEVEKVKDRHIVEAIKHILQYRKSRINEEMNLNDALDGAFKDMEEGRITSHEEVRKKYDKWL